MELMLNHPEVIYSRYRAYPHDIRHDIEKSRFSQESFEPKVEPEAATDILQLKPQQELNVIEHT